MNLRLGPEYERFRDELRAFLRESWPLRGEEAALPCDQRERLFRERALARGYLYRDIPRAYGGSEQPSDVLKDSILAEELAAAGAPGNIRNIGPAMLAPTLIEFGTDEQKRRFVPPTLRGEMLWCQGYSEPGAGSDLASLQSRAVLEGDHWIVTGHKVWTSSAHEAHCMFGLFRTEPDAPKHAGISYLLLDMKAPGVTVRPLRQMTGGAEFNEVFLDEVRVPAGNIVGQRGEGWKVSRATLKHERNLIGDPQLLRKMFDGVVALARRTLRDGRPAIACDDVRQRLAELEGYFWSQQYSGLRQLTAAARGQELKVMLPIMMNKLYSTDLMQRLTSLAYELLGDTGLVMPSPEEAGMALLPDAPGSWTAQYMFAIANSIAGGASNIQRNIIGERGLGLPRDLRPR
ncbi:MAG: acyl-CoA dehydrogenase family protein [Deltaproteobacteria bacterium]|nr:acyl-CoA dehydrogenase family protein [Deltaproteobacteria bacterium]